MARLHKVWETRPSGVYLSALERVYNARLSFLRERELCLGNFTALTPRWNSSLSCLQNVSGRGRGRILEGEGRRSLMLGVNSHAGAVYTQPTLLY